MSPLHLPRWRPDLSPITRRILTVNLIALGLLVVGLLYLGEYRRNLIEAEIASLATQAEMFAAAVGEGAVAADADAVSLGQQALIPGAARQMVRRLVEPTRSRARLFGSDGVLVVDSRMLFGPGGVVQIEDLPPPDDEPGLLSALLDVYDWLVRLLPGGTAYPPYTESSAQTAADYEEVVVALSGEDAAAVRRAGSGLVLSAAAPVQRYKQVVGALMLSKSSRDIDAALLDVRLDILKVFALALAVTVLLSLYLAGTIARPLRRLALAARRLRHGLNRRYRIPRFPGRNDEIGELAEAFSEMTEALWQRMDAIERFAADVAHEIKNPLTSLHSAVETAARLQDPVQQRKLMEIIQEDVRRLDRLISDISDASRLDSELSRAESETFDIAGLVETVVDLQSPGTPESITVALAIEGERPITVNGIESRLVQVFRNLLANAISFSPPGGTVTIRMNRETDHVIATVDDDGPGIPAGKENDIFERFYSERPANESFGTHSGLGLSISRQIAEAHGGSLVAENRHGEDGSVAGARFTVRLPAA